VGKVATVTRLISPPPTALDEVNEVCDSCDSREVNDSGQIDKGGRVN
jgi:hypothetical protein